MPRALPSPADVGPRTNLSAKARQLAVLSTRWQRKADAAFARGDLEMAAQHQERASVAAHHVGMIKLHVASNGGAGR
jgi:hypothetical protein